MADQFNSLKDFQHRYTPRILKELGHFFDVEIEKAKEKDVVLEEMVTVLKEFTLRGGKRVGPLMVILGYLLASSMSKKKDSKGDIVRAACAVETHHLHLLNID